MASPTIAVLRQKIHGLSAVDYATALRDELPEADVAVAETPAAERELVSSAPIVTGYDLGAELIETAENPRSLRRCLRGR